MYLTSVGCFWFFNGTIPCNTFKFGSILTENHYLDQGSRSWGSLLSLILGLTSWKAPQFPRSGSGCNATPEILLWGQTLLYTCLNQQCLLWPCIFVRMVFALEFLPLPVQAITVTAMSRKAFSYSQMLFLWETIEGDYYSDNMREIKPSRVLLFINKL